MAAVHRHATAVVALADTLGAGEGGEAGAAGDDKGVMAMPLAALADALAEAGEPSLLYAARVGALDAVVAVLRARGAVAVKAACLRTLSLYAASAEWRPVLGRNLRVLAALLEEAADASARLGVGPEAGESGVFAAAAVAERLAGARAGGEADKSGEEEEVSYLAGLAALADTLTDGDDGNCGELLGHVRPFEALLGAMWAAHAAQGSAAAGALAASALAVVGRVCEYRGPAARLLRTPAAVEWFFSWPLSPLFLAAPGAWCSAAASVTRVREGHPAALATPAVPALLGRLLEEGTRLGTLSARLRAGKVALPAGAAGADEAVARAWAADEARHTVAGLAGVLAALQETSAAEVVAQSMPALEAPLAAAAPAAGWVRLPHGRSPRELWNVLMLEKADEQSPYQARVVLLLHGYAKTLLLEERRRQNLAVSYPHPAVTALAARLAPREGGEGSAPAADAERRARALKGLTSPPGGAAAMLAGMCSGEPGDDTVRAVSWLLPFCGRDPLAARTVLALFETRLREVSSAAVEVLGGGGGATGEEVEGAGGEAFLLGQARWLAGALARAFSYHSEVCGLAVPRATLATLVRLAGSAAAGVEERLEITRALHRCVRAGHQVSDGRGGTVAVALLEEGALDLVHKALDAACGRELDGSHRPPAPARPAAAAAAAAESESESDPGSSGGEDGVEGVEPHAARVQAAPANRTAWPPPEHLASATDAAVWATDAVDLAAALTLSAAAARGGNAARRKAERRLDRSPPAAVVALPAWLRGPDRGAAAPESASVPAAGAARLMRARTRRERQRLGSAWFSAVLAGAVVAHYDLLASAERRHGAAGAARAPLASVWRHNQVRLVALLRYWHEESPEAAAVLGDSTMARFVSRAGVALADAVRRSDHPADMEASSALIGRVASRGAGLGAQLSGAKAAVALVSALDHVLVQFVRHATHGRELDLSGAWCITRRLAVALYRVLLSATPENRAWLFEADPGGAVSSAVRRVAERVLVELDGLEGAGDDGNGRGDALMARGQWDGVLALVALLREAASSPGRHARTLFLETNLAFRLLRATNRWRLAAAGDRAAPRGRQTALAARHADPLSPSAAVWNRAALSPAAAHRRRPSSRAGLAFGRSGGGGGRGLDAADAVPPPPELAVAAAGVVAGVMDAASCALAAAADAEFLGEVRSALWVFTVSPRGEVARFARRAARGSVGRAGSLCTDQDELAAVALLGAVRRWLGTCRAADWWAAAAAAAAFRSLVPVLWARLADDDGRGPARRVREVKRHAKRPPRDEPGSAGPAQRKGARARHLRFYSIGASALGSSPQSARPASPNTPESPPPPASPPQGGGRRSPSGFSSRHVRSASRFGSAFGVRSASPSRGLASRTRMHAEMGRSLRESALRHRRRQSSTLRVSTAALESVRAADADAGSEAAPPSIRLQVAVDAASPPSEPSASSPSSGGSSESPPSTPAHGHPAGRLPAAVKSAWLRLLPALCPVPDLAELRRACVRVLSARGGRAGGTVVAPEIRAWIEAAFAELETA